MTLSTAQRPRGRTDRSVRRTSTAVAGVAALALALVPALPASAAPGEESTASGQFFSGSLADLSLSGLVDIAPATAANDGTVDPVLERDELTLTALSTVTAEISAGVELPIEFADAGAVSQYALANPDGSSVGASGAVSSSGAIGVDQDPVSEPGPVVLELGDLLSEVSGADILDATLVVGPVSARAAQAAPAGPDRTYEIAELLFMLDSASLGALATDIAAAVDAVSTALGLVDGELTVELEAGPLTAVDITVGAVDLATAIAGLMPATIDGDGFTLDLATGTVTIDLDEITALNGLAPNTPILTSAQLSTIAGNIGTELAAVAAAVDTAVEAAVDGATVTGTAELLGVPIAIDSTIGALRAGSIVGFTGTPIDGLIEAALVTAFDLGLADLEATLGGATDAVDGALAVLEPALTDVVPELVALTANVQTDAGEVFSVTALRIELLPIATPGAAVLNLASASVGPNDALAALLALNPVRGPETGGTLVLVTGTDLDEATSVTIGGITVPVAAVTDTSLEFTTPAHAPGFVDVVVNTPDGPTAPLQFEYYDVADIATIDPGSGPEPGGNTVTITGSCFADVIEVQFGAVTIPAADFVSQSDTEIVVLAPAGVGVVDVSVISEPASDCGDATEDDGYFYYPEDAADALSLTPDSGPESGGTTVTISGSGFGGATGIMIGGNLVTDFVETPAGDTLVFVTPPHVAGVVDVVVLDPDGDSDPLAFEYLPVASVALGLTPGQGPATGGTSVTITGSGFGGATGVTFDGTAGTDFVVVNDSTITVVTPPHAAGVVDVVVLDPTGDSTGLVFEFIAVPGMAMTGWDPAPMIGLGIAALLTGGLAVWFTRRREILG